MSQPRPPDICYLCLTTDRITFCVSQNMKAVFSFVTSYHYHVPFVEARVCWECKALLERFEMFKERAELATRVLEEARRTMQPVEFRSLSNLETTGLVVIDMLTYMGEKEPAPKNIQSMPRRPVATISNKNKDHRKNYNEDKNVINIDEDIDMNLVPLNAIDDDKIGSKQKITQPPKHDKNSNSDENVINIDDDIDTHSVPLNTVDNDKIGSKQKITQPSKYDKNSNSDENVINIDDDDNTECAPEKAFNNNNIWTKQNKTYLQNENNTNNVINIQNSISTEYVPEEISETHVDDTSDDDSLSGDLNESASSKSNNHELDKCNNDSDDSDSDIEFVGLSSDNEKEKDKIDKTTEPLEILFVDAPNNAMYEGKEKEKIKTSYINLTDCENDTESTQNSKTVLKETNTTTVPVLCLNEPMIPVLLSEDKKTLKYFVVDTLPKTNEDISKTEKDTSKKGTSVLRTVRTKQSLNYKQKEKALKVSTKIIDTQCGNVNNEKPANKALEYKEPQNYTAAIEASIAEGRCERYRGTLADVQQLRERYRSASTGSSVCVLCIEIFDSADALYQHVSTKHFKEGELTCEICSNRFTDEGKLSAHVDSHYNMFRCKAKHCQFIDTCVVRIHRHLATAHPCSDFELTTKCKFCGGVFKSRQYFLIHMQKHISVQKYICDYCQKSYDSRSQIFSHIKSVHQQKHLRICEICGKSVAQYWDHMKVHGVFRCYICKVDLSSKDDLSKHVSTHNTGAYKCDICQEKFLTSLQRDIHVKKHTDPCPYVCETCGACFSMKVKLTEHSYCHVTDKKYVCCVCEKRFMFKCKLTMHMKTHFKDETYESACGGKERSAVKIEDTATKKEPVDDGHLPHVKEESTLVEEKSNSLKEKSNSVKRSTSVKEESTLVEEKSNSLKEKSNSVKRSTSVKEESTLVEEKSNSLKEKSNSVKRSTSVKEESTSVKEKSSSVKEKSSSVKEKSTSVREESISVKEEMDIGPTVLQRVPFNSMPCKPETIVEQPSYIQPNACDLCPKWFRTAQGLSVHQQTHTSRRNYECHHCGKVFPTRRQIYLHLPNHTMKLFKAGYK